MQSKNNEVDPPRDWLGFMFAGLMMIIFGLIVPPIVMPVAVPILLELGGIWNIAIYILFVLAAVVFVAITGGTIGRLVNKILPIKNEGIVEKEFSRILRGGKSPVVFGVVMFVSFGIFRIFRSNQLYLYFLPPESRELSRFFILIGLTFLASLPIYFVSVLLRLKATQHKAK